MKKPKKIPLRKCIGCSESKPKQEMIRIVKNKDDEVFIDETGKANGRGAYICKDIKCFERAQKSKAFQKAFGQNVSQEMMETLRRALTDL
ncbi:MAG: YlxR family protein [Peptoniphilus sp.]|nr:YlxR family protein [Peptoniphilus sp.]MDD7362975.1 YlxR family protein [Bacillota bacterium]MDY6044215.1 YlxR family protein [Peptoniphilus sp.]